MVAASLCRARLLAVSELPRFFALLDDPCAMLPKGTFHECVVLLLGARVGTMFYADCNFDVYTKQTSDAALSEVDIVWGAELMCPPPPVRSFLVPDASRVGRALLRFYTLDLLCMNSVFRPPASLAKPST